MLQRDGMQKLLTSTTGSRYEGLCRINTSDEIKNFFTEKEAKNYFSTSYEQWQDGLGEAGIKSAIMLATAEMLESGLAGRFWFSAVIHAKNGLNATFNTVWAQHHMTKCMVRKGCFKVQAIWLQSTTIRNDEKSLLVRQIVNRNALP